MELYLYKSLELDKGRNTLRAKTEGMTLFILIPFVGLKSLWSYSNPLESSGI
jgi:hypothetical protein